MIVRVWLEAGRRCSSLGVMDEMKKKTNYGVCLPPSTSPINSFSIMIGEGSPHHTYTLSSLYVSLPNLTPSFLLGWLFLLGVLLAAGLLFTMVFFVSPIPPPLLSVLPSHVLYQPLFFSSRSSCSLVRFHTLPILPDCPIGLIPPSHR